MRLFLALTFPEAVRTSIHLAAAPLRLAAPQVRWVPPDNLHLTLVFLGQVDAGMCRAVGGALASEAASCAPVDLKFEGVGAFPPRGSPRVLWLGADGGERLLHLQRRLAAAVRSLGLDVEDRPYRAHVTLGRLRAGVDPATRRAIANARETVSCTEHVRIGSVAVMRSQGGPAGPRYTIVERAPLSAPDAERERPRYEARDASNGEDCE